MIEAFLIAMQVAGLVSSYMGAQKQQKIINMGRKLEEAQFKFNMEAIKTESAEQSLMQMKQLRKNIGSQIVMNAARGNRGGSSAWSIEESFTNFNNDERVRRLNLLSKEAELRGGYVLAGLKSTQASTEIDQKLAGKFFETGFNIASGFSGTGQQGKTTFNWGY